MPVTWSSLSNYALFSPSRTYVDLVGHVEVEDKEMAPECAPCLVMRAGRLIGDVIGSASKSGLFCTGSAAPPQSH
jgi:hypothetical protein